MKVSWWMAQFFEKRWKNKMLKKLGSTGYRDYLQSNAKSTLAFYEIEDSDFSNLNVLEVGSGFYGIASVISADSMFAVDPILTSFPSMIGLRKEAIYLPYKGEELTRCFKEPIFDLVFCSNTLNHVENPNSVLFNIKSIMRKKARIYLDVHLQRKSPIHPHSFTKETARTLVKQYFKIHKEFFGNTKTVYNDGDCEIWGCLAQN